MLKRLQILLVVGGVLGFSACKKTSPAPRGVAVVPAAATAPTKLGKPATFIFAKATDTVAELPRRYLAPLPVSVAEFKRFTEGDVRYPPETHVRDSICAGNPAALDAVATAVKSARGQVEALILSYAELIQFCAPNKAYCEQAQQWLAAPELRSLGYRFLANCSGEGAATAFAAKDAPDDAVLAWHAAPRSAAPDCSQRHGQALAAVVKKEPSGSANGRRLEDATRQLAACTDPWVTPTLLAVHRSASGKMKSAIALALRRAQSPELKAIFAAACVAEPDAAECNDNDAPRGLYVVPKEEPRKHAEPSLASLEASVMDNEQPGYVRTKALYEIATRDRARALDVVRKLRLNNGELPSPVRVAANVITAYQDPQAMFADLQQLGLLSAQPEKPLEFEMSFMLIQGGHVNVFDPETGMWPNQHDSLLRDLAAMDAAGMKDIFFDEIAPNDDAGPYKLVAYADGHRYETIAENFGDWYDVSAVVGLLNTVARARKLTTRFSSLSQSVGNTAYVIAGPEPALQSLFARGLLEQADANQDVQDAKAWERRVLDKIATPAANP